MVLRMAQAGTAGSLRERRVESLAAVRQAPADELGAYTKELDQSPRRLSGGVSKRRPADLA